MKLEKPKLLNIQQSASFLGVSSSTVRRWAYANQLTGVKIGTRGDWRFTEEELTKMMHPQKDTFSLVQKLLTEYASQLQKSSSQMRNQLIGSDENSENAKKRRPDYREVVTLLADNLEDVDKGKLLFTALGEKLAKKAHHDGLSLEEAVDGIIFLKQAIWDKFNQKGVLDKFTTHEFYNVNRIISTYTDILAAKIAFSYHDRYKKIEKDLFQLAAIVDSSDDAIISKTLDGEIISWNKGAENLYGYTAEEVIGKSITIIIPKELQKEEKKIINKIKRGQPIEHFETERLRKDGSKAIISLSVSPIKNHHGKIIGASKIARDIAKQKQAEESLRYHAKLIEIVSDAIISTDLDTKIQTWNKAAETMYGYPDKEVLGKKTIDIIATEYNNISRENVLHTLNTKGVWKGEVKQITKYGEIRYVLNSSSLVKDSAGKSIGYVAVNRDISERKKLEQRKDDFVALASHELKTPVTSLKIYAQVLLNRFEKSGDRHMIKYLANMNNQLTKLTDLVTSLLDVSRVQQGKLQYSKEKFTIDDLVQETIENIQRITTTHEILSDGKIVKNVIADRERIGQVLTNLITNAIKYSAQSNKVIVTSSKDTKNVTICVQDFGKGVPRDQQKKIFERFYQASDPEIKTYPGLGLGLYISKEIIERHGGTISLISDQKQKGSTFCFTLPLRGRTRKTNT